MYTLHTAFFTQRILLIILTMEPIFKDTSIFPEKPSNNNSHKIIQVSSNWIAVDGNKQLENVISTAPAINSCYKLTIDDIVNDKLCLEIRPKEENFDCEPCTINITITNGQKINRIGIVSEASVLEIFREFGEYLSTIYADFVDEFSGATVYFADIIFQRPTLEASIKFMRVKNDNRSTMYLYGTRVFLKDLSNTNLPKKFDGDSLMAKFLALSSRQQINGKKDRIESLIESFIPPVSAKNDSAEPAEREKPITNNNLSPVDVSINNSIVNQNNDDLETIIDRKLREMEQRLMEKIEKFESNTNEKLDKIIKFLGIAKN